MHPAILCGGPPLARATLDIAAANADAGTALAERMRRLGRLAGVDGRLHGRLVSAHLAHRPPAAGGPGEWEWCGEALALLPPPPPRSRPVSWSERWEPVRRSTPHPWKPPCAGHRAGRRRGGGDPARRRRAGGRPRRPLARWPRVWERSAVLPARLPA
ncbi:hypothetical protein ACH4PU_32850 [Streptomyces sp. NPDC021100]|uniref:hypothetical protein n=1 Tax=Streptomyces sp. NPDC021100 TaxID=3365114 RepID=UPI0037B1B96C